METNKSFTIYKTQNKKAYYLFFENIIKSTIFKTKLVREPNDLVLYSKDFIITFENPILEKYCKLFCIIDSNDNNRFFVGINISISVLSYGLTGLFLYFDNDKIVDMVIIPEILREYDYKNGIVGSDDTFLYNQSLVFLDKQRDSNVYRITTVCFDYYDKVLGKHTDFTNIIAPYTYYNRWLVFNNSIIMDLGSVYVIFDKLKYNIYHGITNIEHFLSVSQTIETKDYYDEYPINCPKCNSSTCIANYSDKLNNRITILGNSYCHNCSIRYSLSQTKWLCCKMTEPNKFCNKLLGPNYSCNHNNNHNNHNHIKLIYIESYSGKKPYKKSLELFIINL